MGYNWAKDQALKAGLSPTAAPMVAGLFADAVAAPLWIPSEVVTSRLQIQGPGVVKHDTARQVVRHILHAEGVRGLFTGLGAQVVAFGPASALWWASYEGTAGLLRERVFRPAPVSDASGGDSSSTSSGPTAATNHDRRLAPSSDATSSGGGGGAGESQLIPAISGLVAGVLTSVVTNPLDIAKTRLQTQHVLLRDFEAETAARQEHDRSERHDRERRERALRKLSFFKRVRESNDRALQRRAPAIINSMMAVAAPAVAAPAVAPASASAAVAASATAAGGAGGGGAAVAADAGFRVPQSASTRPLAAPAPPATATAAAKAAQAQAQLLMHPSLLRQALNSMAVNVEAARAAAENGLLTAIQRVATVKQRTEATKAAQVALQAAAPSAAAAAPTAAAATTATAAGAKPPPASSVPALGFTPYQTSIALNPLARREAASAERSRIREAASEVVGRVKRVVAARGLSPGGSGGTAAGAGGGGAAGDPAAGGSPTAGRRTAARLRAAAAAAAAPSGATDEAARTSAARRGGTVVWFPPAPAAAAPTHLTAADASDVSSTSTQQQPARPHGPHRAAAAARVGAAATHAHGHHAVAAAVSPPAAPQAASAAKPPQSLLARARTLYYGAERLATKRGGAHEPTAFYPAASLRAAGLSRLHDNMYTMLVSIVRSEGAWALTRGLLPRMVVNGPASAATFVIYEQVLRLSRKEGGAAPGAAAAAAAAPVEGASMLATTSSQRTKQQ